MADEWQLCSQIFVFSASFPLVSVFSFTNYRQQQGFVDSHKPAFQKPLRLNVDFL